MLDLIEYGQETISKLVSYLDIHPSRCQLSPIVEDGKADEPNAEWLGIQYLYQSAQKPSTRLQITLTDERLNFLPLNEGMMAGMGPMRKGEIRAEWISFFDTHPDIAVKGQILELLSLVEQDHFELRAIPWETQFQQFENEFAGLSGYFFPILHFYNPENHWTIIVRAEPVVALENNSSKAQEPLHEEQG